MRRSSSVTRSRTRRVSSSTSPSTRGCAVTRRSSRRSSPRDSSAYLGWDEKVGAGPSATAVADMWSTVTRSVSSVTRLRVGALAWVEPWTSTLWSGSFSSGWRSTRPRWPTRRSDHQCLARPQGAGTSALASISTSASGRSRPWTRSTVTAADRSRPRIWIPRAGGGDILETEAFVGAAAPARVLGGQERRLLRRPNGTACPQGSGQPPDRECTA